MLDIRRYTNEELIKLQENALEKLYRVVPKENHPEVGMILVCEHELTLREGV